MRLFISTGSSSEYGFKNQPMCETDRLEPPEAVREDQRKRDPERQVRLEEIEADEDGAAVIALGEDMFVTAVTRPPAVYRGNPFQVEVGILYSKDLPHDELALYTRWWGATTAPPGSSGSNGRSVRVRLS